VLSVFYNESVLSNGGGGGISKVRTWPGFRRGGLSPGDLSPGGLSPYTDYYTPMFTTCRS